MRYIPVQEVRVVEKTDRAKNPNHQQKKIKQQSFNNSDHLICSFKKWAENRKVLEIAVSVTSAIRIDKADTFFKKLGFQLTGGNYSYMVGK